MKDYVAHFRAKYKNSIGKQYSHCASVKAKSKDEARMKLYEDFEHITHLVLKEVMQ